MIKRALRAKPKIGPCARCGANRLWHLRQVSELRKGGAIPLVPKRKLVSEINFIAAANGRLEALVCSACGHTCFYAADMFDDGDLRSMDEACRCGARRAWEVGPLEERDPEGRLVLFRVLRRKGQARGHFVMRVCANCCEVHWRSRDLSDLRPALFGKVVRARGKCSDCGDEGRVRIRTLKELGDYGPSVLALWLKPTRWGRWPVGSFDVVVCRECSVTEWYAKGYRRLKVSPQAGISLIATEFRIQPEGPYR